MAKKKEAQEPAGKKQAGAGKKKAAEIFDTSERKIDYLRKKYKDFPCFKFGGSIMFDIPRCYDWFSDFLGGKLDMDLDDE